MKSRNHLIGSQTLLILLSMVLMTAVQAQPVEVNSADPNNAEQGTVDFDVVIGGKGFDNSAEVTFFQIGTSNSDGIRVNKTKVRGSKKIIATIDVDPEAFVGDWDIDIQLSGGRGGKGSFLFKVAQKTHSGNNTVESLRVTFSNLASDRFKSDALSNPPAGSLLCSDPASSAAQYWVAGVDGAFVDLACQAGKALAAIAPTLTGSVGLWFESHLAPVRLPAILPPANRWLELDFSEGIDIEGVPSLCPNIDTVEYSHPKTTQPEIAHLVPLVDADPCIDNLEGRFRTGENIFSKSLNELIPGANLQIRIPIVTQLNKKRRQYGVDPAYELVWESLVVTDPGDGNYVTMACDSSLGGSAHTCHATLRKGGMSNGSRYPNDEGIIGDYHMPFSITIQRVFCNADGTDCAVP